MTGSLDAAPRTRGDSVVLHAGQYGTDADTRAQFCDEQSCPLSIIAHVCRTGVTYLCNDTYADPRLPAEGLGPYLPS